MTTAGWIFMIGSISTMLSLLSFSFYRVLSTPESPDNMTTPLSTDTGDLDA